MSDKPKYPKIVRGGHYKWGHQGQSNEFALRDMLNYGAKKFNEGYCDCLAIDCMPVEVEFIDEYMLEVHPNVNYTYGSERSVLFKAQQSWVNKYGSPVESDIDRSY